MAQSESAVAVCGVAATNEGRRCSCYLGENMGLGYDIFEETSDGSPLWVAQAATLKEAEEKLETLARNVPARYFVRDAASAKIVRRAGPDISEKVEP